MFLRICQKLNFPRESFAPLEKAYRTIREDARVAPAFQQACESLLRPDGNVFRPAVEQIAETTGIPLHTVHLVVQVHCLAPLRQIYAENGFREEFFWELAGMIGPQMRACRQVYGHWGNETGLWPWVFHEWQCVRLGRLVFEPMAQWGDVAYRGIQKGDPVILIHIPEGDPLDMDQVTDSLRQGYAYFKDRFAGGVVPFVTDTWLLYPPYQASVFPEGGNVRKFAGLFHILSQYVDETYENFPSVFGCPFQGADLGQMPQKTRLQRNLLAYLQAGNPMGAAHGIFLYGEDGILTDPQPEE